MLKLVKFNRITNITYTQGWQLVAKSGFNHWFLPVKTGWQKVAKNKISLIIKSFLILV